MLTTAQVAQQPRTTDKVTMMTFTIHAKSTMQVEYDRQAAMRTARRLSSESTEPVRVCVGQDAQTVLATYQHGKRVKQC